MQNVLYNSTYVYNSTIDVLIKEDVYNKSPYIRSAGFGAGGAPTDFYGANNFGASGGKVIYNGQSYIVLVNFKAGFIYKKLFQNSVNAENYVIRLNVPNMPPAYYPLNSVFNAANATDNSRSLVRVTKWLPYDLNTKVSGVIKYLGAPRRDVKVEVVIRKEDLAGSDSSTTRFTATTDGDGVYSFNKLPPLKFGSTISMVLTDKTIRPVAFTDAVKFNDSLTINKNIDLVNRIYSIMGRVVDKTGLPVINALVTVEGDSTSQQVRTTAEGFYALKAYSTNNKITYTLDGFTPVEKSMGAPGLTTSYALNASQWKGLFMQGNSIYFYKKQRSVDEVTADVLGIGTGTMESVFDIYFKDEVLVGIQRMDDMVFDVQKGKVNMVIRFGGKTVNANLTLSTGLSLSTKNAETFTIPLEKGHYTVQLDPFDEDAAFVPFTAEFDITANNTTSIAIALTAGVRLRGTVSNSITNKPIDSALVTVKDMPFESLTKADGKYLIILPKLQEFEFEFTNRRYNASDTSYYTPTADKTVDYKLELRDSTLPYIETIAGFPVNVTKQVKGGSASSYLISGKLFVDKNGIFSPDSSNNSLTFRNISVNVTSGAKNALPSADINFEEGSLTTTAFGFAPIEIEGFPQIQMKGLKNSSGNVTYDHCVIGGGEITLKLSEAKSVASLPIKLTDATLKINDSSLNKEDDERAKRGVGRFNYVYTAPDYKINALNEDQSFSMEFEEPGTTVTKNIGGKAATVDEKYLAVPLGVITTLYVEKSEASLDKDGLALNGYLQFPKLVGAKMPDSGKVVIDKFLIGENFSITELTFKVSKKKP
ncbi:MAG: carboxypeptidase regulatory-like domain-containing protein, partial [Sphingobacteriales bacterium]|nr:carboxypeptidase regulatory-like domain-containing protein [Sphingobacteriales bacterium]